MSCTNDVTDKVNNNAVGSQELAVNIKRIRQLTKDLQATTDCDALKQKLGITGDELKELTKDIRAEAKKILEKYLPIASIPTNPLKIIPWAKKLVTGTIMPQLEAYIKLLQQAIELLLAVREFIAAAQQVLPRIEQCVIDTVNEQIDGAIGVINLEIQNIVNEIVGAINDAICKSGIADLLSVVNSAINTTKDLISAVNQTIADADAAVGSTLSSIQNIGNVASEVTGVSFNVDTSTPNAFVNSINDGAFQTFQTNVQTFLDKAPATNTVVPTISGTPVVGRVLTASTGSWEGDDVAYSFQWYRGETPIYDAKTSTYTLADEDEGKPVTVILSGDNDAGGEFVNAAPTAVVVKIPPSPTSPPAITGNAQLGETLTVSSGSWSSPEEAGTLSFQYQWQWAHVSANIYSANTTTYVINVEDVGRTLTCEVTATNNSGNTKARAEPTVVVIGNVAITGTLSVIGNTQINSGSLSVTSGSITTTGSVSGGSVSVTGSITADGNITANNDGAAISLVTHTHSDVTSGVDRSGPP